MMPLSTFNVLLAVVFLLAIYSIIDHRNTLYGNIVAAILSSIIGALLAILVYIGAIIVDTDLYVSDFPTASILIFVSAVMAIYAFFMVLEAKEEYDSAKNEGGFP